MTSQQAAVHPSQTPPILIFPPKLAMVVDEDGG
jgi:hypothetical protein